MTLTPDTVEPSAPADPAAYGRRPRNGGLPLSVWALIAFGLICVFAGIAVARYGPRLFPAPPPAASVPAASLAPGPITPAPTTGPLAGAAPAEAAPADLSAIQRALCLSPAVARGLTQRKIPTVASAALPNDGALLKLL